MQLQVGQLLLVSRVLLEIRKKAFNAEASFGTVRSALEILLADLMICAFLRSAEGGYTHDVESLGLHMTRSIPVSKCDSAPVSGSQR